MKILIVQNTLSAYNVPLFEKISRNENIELTVFCFTSELDRTKYRDDATKPSFEIIQCDKSAIRTFFLTKFGICLPSLKLYREIYNRLPDVMAIDGLSSVGNALMIFTSNIWKRIPVLWWSLGAIPQRKQSLRARFGDFIQKFCATRAAAIFSYGTYSRDYFLSLGIDSNKIVVGHNTIDEQTVINDIERIDINQISSLKRKLSIPVREKTAVYCGRLTSGKNVDVLLSAFAKVVNKNEAESYHLVIIGDGPERHNLEAAAKQLKLEDSVTFVGQQHDDLSLYFLQGSFCVLPGLGGLAINHAFAHSLPVICGPADGTEIDLVQTGKTGVLVENACEESLIAAMSQLFNDPALCMEMGKEAHSLITGKFSLDSYCERFVNTAKVAHASNRYPNSDE